MRLLTTNVLSEVLADLRADGLLSGCDEMVIVMAVEARASRQSGGVLLEDPPLDWRSIRAVLLIMAGLLVLTVAVLDVLCWRGAHP